MNCPICNKELEIKQKKVGETANGEAIFNEFAICHDCRKQWNLDKHRAKQADASRPKEAVKEPVREAVQEEQPVKKRKKRPAAPAEAEAPVKVTEEVQDRPRKKKKRPVTEEGQAPKKVAPADPAATKVMPTEELDALLQEKARKPKKKRPAPMDPVMDEEAPVKRRPAKKSSPVELEVRDEFEERPRKVKKKRPAPVESVMDEEAPVKRRPAKKRPRPVEAQGARDVDELLADIDYEEDRPYSNIPPKHIRESREKEMRENYQHMLDEDDEDEGGAPIILILIIIILLLAVAAFAGYWFLLR